MVDFDRTDSFTVYVTIGNTDGKLTAREYQSFLAHVKNLMELYSINLPGGDWWHTCPSSGRQSAVLVAIMPNQSMVLAELRRKLAETAARFKQDSIAFVLGSTELIAAVHTAQTMKQWPTAERPIVAQPVNA